ncbi:MAG: phenylalanine--tRNA ligase subunit beta [Lachnospiraceae bacterium]|nr:phenylalanine--tRNA ligase subunit beta [Lachnospiraceae bacterium]
MNTPLSWIKAFVPDLDCTAQQYMDAMTLSGSKVEGYRAFDKNLDKIVIGQILSITPHPDADKLIVCQVNVGKETVQIVTGAHNVSEGDKVPVVLDGGRVAGGHDGGPLPDDGIKIKKGKLRGVESFGMMCAIEELGSTKEFYPEAAEDGIYIFPEDAEVGADAIEALGLHDVDFEYEITSNRVDCFSIIGIAREAAATFGCDFILKKPAVTGDGDDIANHFSVEIEAPDLCRRFTARMIRNVKIGPSPRWMQRRLAACGIRPINNLVDITNYVMKEYGQPMHAYDMRTIAGNKIIVRRANDGDEFITLDGQTRKLDHDMLMICDAEKEIGIAGIMGGQNSMIIEDVDTVLFEAACFDGTNVRLSSKRLGMRTDASSVFEKGIDPAGVAEAINRACELVEELGCGEVVGGIIDEHGELPVPKEIPFRPDWINRFIGTDISEADMVRYLEKIELKVDLAASKVIVPTWRQDLEQEADIAEEVARFYGYDNIPTTLPRGEATAGKLSFKLRIEELARKVAQFAGFDQAMTYSFDSPKTFDRLQIPADDPVRKAVEISNPLGEDFSIMRTLPLGGILTSLALNYNHRNKDVKLYELAHIYLPAQVPVTELPDERVQFVLGFYGEGDFFSLKGVVEEFFTQAGLKKKPAYIADAALPFFHPGRKAEIEYDGRKIGYMGELHPTVAESYDIGERAYIAVIDMPVVTELASFDIKYRGVAKYPAVTRDISVMMLKEVTAAQIEGAIEKCGGKLLESYELFDVYEGAQILTGHKSMAYSITFRAKDHTLEDAEVNRIMEKLFKTLSGMGIELRS